MAVFQADAVPAYDATDLSGTVKKLYYYSMELTDQLAWLLANLDNDNVPALEGIQKQLTDAQGNLSEISQSTAGILTRVEDAEGDISTLTQTAQGLQTRLQGAEGDISTLTQTAQGLQTRVQSAEGSVSTLTQTAEDITLAVSNLEEDVNAIIVGDQDITIKASDVVFDGNGEDLGLQLNGKGAIFTSSSGVITYCGNNSYATTSGYFTVNASDEINISSGDNVNIKSDGYIRLYTSGSRYWEFRGSGIYYCDEDDGDISVTQLRSL